MKFVEAIKTNGIGRKVLVVGGIALGALAIGFMGKKTYDDMQNSTALEEVACAEEVSVEESEN